jgi:Tfp pilus assembly protein PilO
VVACLALTLLLAAANLLLWQGRKASAQEHETVKRQGEMLIRSLAERPGVDADLTALEAALAQIDRNLIEEQSMEVNLGYFYKLEKATRVRLTRLNQLAAPAPAKDAPFKAVPFSMQVAGSYRNSMNFLRSLETGPCILRVRNCSFERNSSEANDVVVDLTVEILAQI